MGKRFVGLDERGQFVFSAAKLQTRVITAIDWPMAV